MDKNFMDSLKAILKADEGWSATPYRDTQGVLTIGYGTNIEKISKEEGDMLLDSRLKNFIEKDLATLDPEELASLNKDRLIVYGSMLYNLGLRRFCGFKKMRQAVKDKDWGKAAIEMLDSKWYKQVGKRAERLAAIMRTGELNEWFRK